MGVYLCTRNLNTALATFSVLTLNLCSQGKCVMGFTYLHLEAWRHPAKQEAGECANSLVHHCVSIYCEAQARVRQGLARVGP